MINFFHCPECHTFSEIKTDSDYEIMETPRFCPWCGYKEEIDEEENSDFDDDESLDDYY